MDKNITNLGHLRSAMRETKRQTAGTLEAVVDAIEELASVIVTEEQMSVIVKEAVREVLNETISGGGTQ